MEKVLTVNNLTKNYKSYSKNSDRFKEVFTNKTYHKEIVALSDVSFSLRKGEILGIIGNNGAGKSTLLKIITGVLHPDLGEVSIQGKVESMLELGVAFNMELTGIENIKFYLQLRNIQMSKREEIINKIIEFSELDEYIYYPVKSYSSGMFARLAFATFVNLEYDILIVDEVLSVGDINFQNKCIEKMKEISREGKSIIFVSHDMHSIKYFCKNVMRLDRGCIIDYGNNIVDIVERYEKNIKHSLVNEKEEINNVSDIVRIKNMYFCNEFGKRQNRFEINNNFSVVVDYESNGIPENYFFGIGFRNSNNDYICGLNTKIDKFQFNREKGNHRIVLEYKNVNLYNDIYTFWSVFYNDTGTCILSDYIIRDGLEIYSRGQFCEGVVLIEHEWECKS